MRCRPLLVCCVCRYSVRHAPSRLAQASSALEQQQQQQLLEQQQRQQQQQQQLHPAGPGCQ
jgi:hemolysin activation/secretion protein